MDTELLQAISPELPRITRQQFCDHMDEILDKIESEGCAYVITSENGPELLVTPASWYNYISNEDLRTLIVCAVRYAMGRRSHMPSVVDDIVRRCMDKLEDSTLSIIARDINEELSVQADRIDATLWMELRDDIRKLIDSRQRR